MLKRELNQPFVEQQRARRYGCRRAPSYIWSGNSVESRIKGHAKSGARKFRCCHQGYAPKAMTNDFMSSQSSCCSFKVIVSGESIKLLAITITSICINPKCPSYKTRRSRRNLNFQSESVHCFSSSQ